MPLVSFVIPAHNEERLLPQTLLCLHAAARNCGCDYEIVVADDASTDGTAAVAGAHGARVVSVSHRQIAATRNSGGRASTGEWIIFVDADTLVPARTLRATLRALGRGAAGGGAPVRFDGALPLHMRIMLPPFLVLYRLADLAAGCFVFCTRRTFERTGGFDEAYFAGEEYWMSQAIKRCGRFVLVRDAVLTSGRKLRTFSAAEILALLLRAAWHGPAAVRQREGLELWYGERRTDPHEAEGPTAIRE